MDYLLEILGETGVMVVTITCHGTMQRSMPMSSTFGKILPPEAAETLKMLREERAGVSDNAHLIEMLCVKELNALSPMLLVAAFKSQKLA